MVAGAVDWPLEHAFPVGHASRQCGCCSLGRSGAYLVQAVRDTGHVLSVHLDPMELHTLKRALNANGDGRPLGLRPRGHELRLPRRYGRALSAAESFPLRAAVAQNVRTDCCPSLVLDKKQGAKRKGPSARTPPSHF